MFATAHAKINRAAFVLLLAILTVGIIFPAPLVYAAVIVNDPAHTGVSKGNWLTSGKNLIESTLQTAKSFAMHLKEFVGDKLANVLAKAALRTITQGIVNWINSGFKGSPAFVTNPEGFLFDVADQVIGQALEYAAPFLCSPFRLDIRASLGLNFSFNTQDQIRCRLTDVIANVQGSYDSFVSGNFSSGGWTSWINITGSPQNNPYGAFLETADLLDMRIISAGSEANFDRQIGNGFLSWRECKVPGETITVKDSKGKPIIGQNGQAITKQGPCKEKGPVKTPGSVIEGQLNTALGVDLQSLGLADEINEIFGALLNQLVKKVFTSGGLASAANYSGSFEANVELPVGNNLSPQEKERRSRFNQIVSAAEQEDKNGTVQGVAFGDREGGTPTRNQGLLTQSGNNRDQANAQVIAEDATGSATDTNIAVNKKAEQSSTYAESENGFVIVYAATNAVNGTDSDSGAIAKTILNVRPVPWWEVDLGTDQQEARFEVTSIKEVRITRRPVATHQSENLYLVASDMHLDPSRTFAVAGKTQAELDQASPIPGVSLYRVPNRAEQPGDVAQVVFKQQDQTKRFLRIYHATGAHLSLIEVRVLGQHKRLGQQKPAQAPTYDVIFDPSVSDILPNLRIGEAFWKPIQMRVNEDLDGVSFRARLYENNQPTPFTNRFSDITVKVRSGDTNQTSPDFISESGADRFFNDALKSLSPDNQKLFPNGPTLADLASPVTFAKDLSIDKDRIGWLELDARIVSGVPRAPYRIEIESYKETTVLGRSVIHFTID